MKNKIAVLITCSLGALGTAAAWGQQQPGSYPDHTVRLVEPNAAGGGIDLMVRSLAQSLSKTWGQPVIADNRPGAGAIIATTAVAKAPHDGYTLLVASNSMAVSAAVYKELPYDSKKDFIPIVLMVTSPEVLTVRAASDIHSVADLLAKAKRSPSRINYGSAGTGTLAHLAGESFSQRTGMNAVHVPYKGSAPALQALLAGQVDWLFDAPSGVLAQVKGGQARAIAVVAPKRTALLPDVPTMAQEGFSDVNFLIWVALMAPAGTPANVTAKIERDVNQALMEPGLRSAVTAQGWDVAGGPSREFAVFLDGEYDKMARAVHAAGMVAQ